MRLIFSTAVYCSALAGIFSLGASVAAADEVNNGTNPTILATTAGIQYKYSDLRSGLSNGLFEAYFTQPIGAKGNMAIGINIPYASGPLDDSFGLGDISLKFTHVPSVTPDWGIAYTAEIFFDTAERADLGAGQTVGKFSGFYARFLGNGHIFAPAVVQQISLSDPEAGRANVNNTTIDFYYVPKLADPRFFATFDPALIHDWESNATYGSLSVTLGMLTGEVFGGDSQVFIKPQILAGSDRPADWSLQVGYKVIGF